MNKFQKDLKDIREKFIKNTEEQEKLKSKKENYKEEITKLNLDVYECDKLISEYNMIRRNAKQIGNQKNNLKQNYIKKFLITLILETIILCCSKTLSILLVSVSAIFSIVYTTLLTSKFSKKLKSLKLKYEAITKKLTREEIIKKIKYLSIEKESKLNTIKELNDNIEKIDSNLIRLEKEIEKFYLNYGIILETYQNLLEKIDPSISDAEMEKILNNEYNFNKPLMLKKIYNKKND